MDQINMPFSSVRGAAKMMLTGQGFRRKLIDQEAKFLRANAFGDSGIRLVCTGQTDGHEM